MLGHHGLFILLFIKKAAHNLNSFEYTIYFSFIVIESWLHRTF
ncbi:hypothetical protein P278_06320 [Zhouia amylolytica AD3]|uniref:Uncharacterized protein n=1 Tax=Zhouia amylolytica AD3 TaxID=1286632 RepID=W2URH5_9FLAO|nr:hypothetical protein P278_06320 [Zhouia amylolytica AD3]